MAIFFPLTSCYFGTTLPTKCMALVSLLLSLHWYFFKKKKKNKNKKKNSWWIEILVWMGREKHELPQACKEAKEPFSPQKWICMLLAFSRSVMVGKHIRRKREREREREMYRIVSEKVEKTDGSKSSPSAGRSFVRWVLHDVAGAELSWRTSLFLSPLWFSTRLEANDRS